LFELDIYHDAHHADHSDASHNNIHPDIRTFTVSEVGSC
jgi:hypothetical protein